MDTYIYQYHAYLPISVEEAWRFFSNPKNMEIIQSIPPVNVKLNNKSVEVSIPYTFRLLSFNTIIVEEDAPNYFIDRMEKPPYPFTYWKHRHQFHKNGNHTKMIDQVSFQTKWAPSFMSFGLTQMFKTREKKLIAYFSSP